MTKMVVREPWNVENLIIYFSIMQYFGFMILMQSVFEKISSTFKNTEGTRDKSK